MMNPLKDIPIVQIHGKTYHEALRFSHFAMATVFEIFIIHDDVEYPRQAVREAWQELDRLEQDLSRFIENSDISRINRLRAGQSITVGLDTLECLKQCSQLHKDTFGAFDICIGSLLNCWSDRKHPPSTKSLKRALENTCMDLLELDEIHMCVKGSRDSLSIDLGGFGKGYAIDRIADLLQEWEINSALIHGGKSSVLALDAPSGERGWDVTMSHPGRENEILAHMHLNNRALSGSGMEKGQHIIDPRTGYPVEGRLAAWASTPLGATSDALSTALMVMTPNEIKTYCLEHPDTRAMVILQDMDRNDENVLKWGEWE